MAVPVSLVLANLLGASNNILGPEAISTRGGGSPTVFIGGGVVTCFIEVTVDTRRELEEPDSVAEFYIFRL